MTRLHRRAVLAMTAALAGIVLHGQPTSADNGLIDLDGLRAVVFGSPITQPDGGRTPVAALLDGTIAILDQPIAVVGSATGLSTAPPVIPLPVIPQPGDGPTPAPPIADPDVGPTPDPPIAGPPLLAPDVGGPPTVGDGGGGSPPAPDPGGSTDTGQGPAIDPAATDPPVILGPADGGGTTATGDADRGRGVTAVRDLAPGIGASAESAGSASSAAPPPQGLVPLPAGWTTLDLDGTDSVLPQANGDDAEHAAALRTLPVETTEGNVTAVSGGGLPIVALGAVLAALAALSIVIAVVRRAISRRDQRAALAVDHRREPPDRVSADTRPNSREPRPGVGGRPVERREPPGRVSADTRPNPREPRPGVGGRPVERVGRGRRVPRNPPARSARTNTRRPAGSRLVPRAANRPLDRQPVGGRAAVTRLARRTAG